MLESGRNDQIEGDPTTLPPTKITDLPSLKWSRFSVPWLIPPKPSQAEVDCGVFEE